MATVSWTPTVQYGGRAMACNKQWMVQIGDEADRVQFMQIRPWCNSLLSLLVGVPVTRLSKDKTHTYTIAGHPQFKALLDARNNAQANDLLEKKPTEAAAEGLARLFAWGAHGEANGSDEQPSKVARVEGRARKQHVMSRRSGTKPSVDDIITVHIGDASFACIRPRIARDGLVVKCDSANMTVVLDFLHAEIKTIGDLCYEAYDRNGAYAKRDADAEGDGDEEAGEENDDKEIFDNENDDKPGDAADDKENDDIENDDKENDDKPGDDPADAAPAAAPSAAGPSA
jgi:hypothetical protein